MPDRGVQFAEFERLLRQAGIIDASAQRLVEELRDHYEDLLAAARERGCDPRRARAAASRAIGSPADIAAVAAQHRELVGFPRRHPLLGCLSRGFVSVIAVPCLPVQYCAHRREAIVRWSASVGLAGLMTAALLLSMQSVVGIG